MADVTRVRLRPVQEADLAALEDSHSREADPWNWFRHMPAGAVDRTRSIRAPGRSVSRLPGGRWLGRLGGDPEGAGRELGGDISRTARG